MEVENMHNWTVCDCLWHCDPIEANRKSTSTTDVKLSYRDELSSYCNHVLMNTLLIVIAAGGYIRWQSATVQEQLLQRWGGGPRSAKLPTCWLKVSALSTCHRNKPGLPDMAIRRTNTPWPLEKPYSPWLQRLQAIGNELNCQVTAFSYHYKFL